MMLSDGTKVPANLPAWARRMRSTVISLGNRPTLSDVGDLRKLLACRPLEYLGSDWEQLVCDSAVWLASIEASLKPLAHGGLMFTPPLMPGEADARVSA